jgi:protein tyrosine phosphatase (PTP) superfamily phosphohydrolase (DUF442 family)
MRRVTHRFFAFAIAGALCVSPCGGAPALGSERPSAATGSSDVPHTIGKKIRVSGVANFGKVTPTLYRGAQPTKKGFENLSKMGVGIVVDLRDGDEHGQEEKDVTALGMKFVAIPWRCSSPKDGYFAKFLTVLRDNPDKKVFVHCHVGVDRTGMMIASYRMAEQGWTAEEALREMKAFGFSPFHQLMCYGLDSYEQRFPSVVSSSPAFQNWRGANDKPAVAVPPKQ